MFAPRRTHRPVYEHPVQQVQVENPLGTCGNVVWIFFGGWIVSALYTIAGLLLTCTICGIPMATQMFKLARLSLWVSLFLKK